MDNYNSNGSGNAEDIFGFIPPNLMFPDDNLTKNSCKEEALRHEYHNNHDDSFHIKDTPPATKKLER